MRKRAIDSKGTCLIFPAVQPRGSISICVESSFMTPQAICSESVFTVCHTIATHVLTDEHYKQPASTGPYSTSDLI
jgi:hypothetical protein